MIHANDALIGYTFCVIQYVTRYKCHHIPTYNKQVEETQRQYVNLF